MSTFLYSNFPVISACVELLDVLWALLHIHIFSFHPCSPVGLHAQSGHSVPFHPLTHATDMFYFLSVTHHHFPKTIGSGQHLQDTGFRGLTCANIVIFYFVSNLIHLHLHTWVNQMHSHRWFINDHRRGARTKVNLSKLFHRGVN